MGDRFSPLPIERLFRWLCGENHQGTLLGFSRELFFKPNPDDPFRMTRFGRTLETPIGVAAGPHTQLSQNIVLAWLMGARYIELKTAQTLDQIEVSKPCIDMEDEGYNCEWSQELSLDETYHEYLNAWIMLHLLRDKLDWGTSAQPGFLFNMSLGYDMAGILKPNVQDFLARMSDSRLEKNARIEALLPMYPRLENLNIPDCISDNITLSTMHGCPPDEIEKIGRYLIEERRLHTVIKLNPTLLGASDLRRILNETLGYRVEVPDAAFEHDPKMADALPLIHALQESADKAGVQFGLKLTNTLEVVNRDTGLPGNEQMVYLSGRALHPISIQVAARLQDHFKGELDISFCAGIDCFNAADVLAGNLGPVTVCSDLLKPGGYTRLGQYLDEIRGALRKTGSATLDEYIMAKGTDDHTQAAGWKYLRKYAAAVLEKPVYQKSHAFYTDIKTGRDLHAFDCIQAPCVTACAVDQAVPDYMYHVAQGNLDEAFRVILDDNPLPHTTGMVCNHLCEPKCTRINYDNPLLIREIKRFVAEHSPGKIKSGPSRTRRPKVAIIGAGPSGMSCAWFLAVAGLEVHLYEGRESGGGMAAHAIPSFRLEQTSVQQDMDGILALGVVLHSGAKIDQAAFRELQKEYSRIYIAVGAQKAKLLGLPGEDAEGVIDQLAFLNAVHQGHELRIGPRAAVIGGGDSAMDAARTARRMVEEQGEVTLIYRRTRAEMPAAKDEIEALVTEGITIMELTAPEALVVEDGRLSALICSRMQLGEPDESGRPRPVKIAGLEFRIPVDTLIPAIGQEVVLDFIPGGTIKVMPGTFVTQIPNVYAGGDAVRGADTLINAIADGKQAAQEILASLESNWPEQRPPLDKGLEPRDFQRMQACREFGPPASEVTPDQRLGFELVHPGLDENTARTEATRCLFCDEFCNICVSVCPNLANLGYTVEPLSLDIPKARIVGNVVEHGTAGTFNITQRHQILNIGDFCNECGNCTTFCPTSGAPFRDKPRFYLSEATYTEEENGYFMDGNRLKRKRDGREAILSLENGAYLYETDCIQARLAGSNFALNDVRIDSDSEDWLDFNTAAEMYVLLIALKDHPLFEH